MIDEDDPFIQHMIELLKKPLTEEQIKAGAKGTLECFTFKRTCCGDPADCDEDCS